MGSNEKSSALFSLIAILASNMTIPQANAAGIPAPVGDIYVQDFANVLTSNQKGELVELGMYLDNETGAQIAVLIVNSLDNRTIEDYAVQAFRDYGLGGAEKNNGVLFLLSLEEREMRIEVGYGLEGVPPDAKTGRIMDNYAMPYLKQNEIDQAVMSTFKQLFNEVASEYNLEQGYIYENEEYQESEGPSPLTIMIFTFIILGIVFLDFRFLGGAFTLTLIKILAALARNGGGRGGGGGGGPRIGGGGSSGGGGASRRW